MAHNYALQWLQAYKVAHEATLKAKKAHEAAQGDLQKSCILQQPYWCDGAGSSTAALEAWLSAGLPLRAVVHLKAPLEDAHTTEGPALLRGTSGGTFC